MDLKKCGLCILAPLAALIAAPAFGQTYNLTLLDHTLHTSVSLGSPGLKEDYQVEDLKKNQSRTLRSGDSLTFVLTRNDGKPVTTLAASFVLTGEGLEKTPLLFVLQDQDRTRPVLEFHGTPEARSAFLEHLRENKITLAFKGWDQLTTLGKTAQDSGMTPALESKAAGSEPAAGPGEVEPMDLSA